MAKSLRAVACYKLIKFRRLLTAEQINFVPKRINTSIYIKNNGRYVRKNCCRHKVIINIGTHLRMGHHGATSYVYLKHKDYVRLFGNLPV